MDLNPPETAMKQTRNEPKNNPQDNRGKRLGHGSVGRFVLIFLLLSLTVSVLDVFATKKDLGHGYRKAIAEMATTTSRPFLAEIQSRGSMIYAGTKLLEVSFECTALHETGIFLAAVLAMPIAWRRRAPGVLVGLGGVFLLNLIRIAGLAIISGVWPSMFKTAHDVFMQGFILIMVAPLWILWAIWASRIPGSKSPTTE